MIKKPTKINLEKPERKFGGLYCYKCEAYIPDGEVAPGRYHKVCGTKLYLKLFQQASNH